MSFIYICEPTRTWGGGLLAKPCKLSQFARFWLEEKFYKFFNFESNYEKDYSETLRNGGGAK